MQKNTMIDRVGGRRLVQQNKSNTSTYTYFTILSRYDCILCDVLFCDIVFSIMYNYWHIRVNVAVSAYCSAIYITHQRAGRGGQV